MAVNVQIKQSGFFKKTLTVPEIAAMCNMKYGISDENFRLKGDELDEFSLLYNPDKLARGIEISFDDKDINLKLSLPTTGGEVRDFYGVIEKICGRLKLKEYFRDDERVSVDDSQHCITADMTASADALMSIGDKIQNGETDNFIILGISNPISLGPEEIKVIDGDYDNFEKLLDRLQQMDVYYAAPLVYSKAEDHLFGCYAIGEDIPSVVPTKPYILMSNLDVKEWYVLMPNNTVVRYENFIENVSQKVHYDGNHVIVNVSASDIAMFKEKYQTEI